MDYGKIILLNGTSSAGKTSLARKLLSMNDKYIYLSLDDFMEGIKQLYLSLFPFLKNEEQQKVETGHQITEKPQIYLLHSTIKAFSSIGKNIIVDHVLHDREWLNDFLKQLEGLPVFLVGVHCPLYELERRERERGDRRIGLAKSQFDKVHIHMLYDIEVNTYDLDIQECSYIILKFIEDDLNSNASNKLRVAIVDQVKN